MSFESQLAALTDAIKELTAAVKESQAASPAAPSKPAKADKPAPSKPAAKKPVKADDSDVATGDIDEVREKLKEVVAKFDRKRATEILQASGADKLTNLDESKYSDVISACKEVLEAEEEDEEDF